MGYNATASPQSQTGSPHSILFNFQLSYYFINIRPPFSEPQGSTFTPSWTSAATMIMGPQQCRRQCSRLWSLDKERPSDCLDTSCDTAICQTGHLERFGPPQTFIRTQFNQFGVPLYSNPTAISKDPEHRRGSGKVDI